MLMSMTGFGEAHCQQDGLAVAVEVRAINNRYFKLSVRASEGYGGLEPLVEATLRKSIRRGTIQVSVRVDRRRSAEDFNINADVLEQYRRQLAALRQRWNSAEEVPLQALLPLPGVVDQQNAEQADTESDWPLIQRTLEAAMANLDRMRTDEGRAMAADLLTNVRAAAAGLADIERRAPQVAEGYRARLDQRLRKILTEFNVALDPGDLIREVGLFAERSDISEETVRLRSHFEQFDTIMNEPESAGRKLEFLTQEIFREINTIGSKANDVEISRHVIEIKAAVERIREMLQNIE